MMRRLLAGLGTALVAAASAWNAGGLPLGGLARAALSAVGAVMLYASVALASAIHRSYPARHDSPGDVGELYTEGPYRLCRHPFYMLVMLAQAAMALTLASPAGLLVAAALIPAWIALARVEEGELIEYWGDKYREYMKETPLLFPSLRRILRRPFKSRSHPGNQA